MSVKIWVNPKFRKGFKCTWHVSVKSFYSLDYTGQDFSDKASEKGGSRDYVKIIEELQSHRKEIEQLHFDLASCTDQSAQKMKGSDMLNNEA